MKISIHK